MSDNDTTTETELPFDDAPEVAAAGESAESEPATADEPKRNKRGLLVAAGLAAVVVLGGTGIAIAATHKTVDLDVDGTIVQVSTFGSSVGDVLAEEGITVGEYDMVVPAVADPIGEGTDIVVRTAEQVEVVIDGEATDIWTVDQTAAATLANLAASGRDAELVASRTAERPMLDLPLVDSGSVTFIADGAEQVVDFDGTADLATALMNAEITVDLDDRITVSTDAAGGPVVTVTRISVDQATTTEVIPFESIERGTDDLYEGESRVVSEGSDGLRTYTYSQRLVDGDVVSSRFVSVVVNQQPVANIVEYGTAQRPVVQAPAPTPASTDSSSSGSSDSSSGAAPTGDVWAALAQCESGGNPTTNTGNGYYGLYQFSLPTWQAVGGTGLPSEASAAEQTRLAQILQARSGWGQWPACAAKLGLL